MIRLLIDVPDTPAAAALVDVLLAVADRVELHHPAEARRWRRIADGIGDGLDALDTSHRGGTHR